MSTGRMENIKELMIKIILNPYLEILNVEKIQTRPISWVH